MTQAFNLSQFANFVNTSGQVSNSGLQNPAVPSYVIPTGTLMLFQQTSAPTGWTKQTTHDNKALRVVSGTAGSGGTTNFTTVFTNQTPSSGSFAISGTTLSTAQLASHTHNYAERYYYQYGEGGSISAGPGYRNDVNVSYTGGNGSHTHGLSGALGAITLNVQYVDLIIASKT